VPQKSKAHALCIHLTNILSSIKMYHEIAACHIPEGFNTQ
jgi:hypothetical protein